MPKTNNDSQPMNATNNQYSSNPIKELKILIEEKSRTNLEHQITSVENRISSQYVDIRNSTRQSKSQLSNLLK